MADRRRIAAALEYLGAMRDRAAEFGSGVAGTLANRARDVGGLAYEALTSDPNIGRMNTAEFSEASDRPTPRLDAAAQGIGALGKALITQPVQTGKAIVRGEIDRAKGAFDSPRAAGEYAGSMVNPLRLASALRRPPMQELDVYHGTPHRFEPTEANPLGELDASKIGSGEGAQAYGHGIYLAENPGVAKSYISAGGSQTNMPDSYAADIVGMMGNEEKALAHLKNILPPKGEKTFGGESRELIEQAIQNIESGAYKSRSGSLYTLDLPDQMIDRMLDWDKPLDDWTANKLLSAVRKKGMKESDYEDALGVSSAYQGQPESGSSIYRLLAADLGGEMQASQFLKDMGIPGIRYLDAGSRGKDGTGTRNFVVFPGEEKKVKILRRE